VSADADTEAQLAERLAARDLASAATIGIRHFGPPILAYLTSVLRNDADAADAFSAFCEDAWRGIGEFRHECAFKTWAYKLAWHAALRVAREPHRRRARRLETADAERLATEVRSTTAMHLRTGPRDALAAIRETLDSEERTLLVLRLDRDLAWSEIATVLGDKHTEAALRKRFERLKEKVRREALARGLLPK
jgi:RNA polymerase sigma-70 factor (ECF subfamily)